TKQALLLGLSVVSLWGHWIFLGLLSAAMVCLFRSIQVRFDRLIAEIRYFLLFLCVVFAVRTLTFEGGWIPVLAFASASEAMFICWRLLLVVCMGLLLMATTRTGQIRAALVWFLKPVPVIDEKMAATMLGLVVRFLPQILYQAAEISDAQRARGIDRRKNVPVRLMRFSIALFRRVFLSADELVAAMQARCYNEQRTLPDLRFARRDGMAAAAATLVCLTVWLP
ncbi:MAG: energy-coupling factor transporter transmembrane component T, partial [Desulfosarcina sp.]